MNIFGIGTAEFVLIILIMLVVAGPQRMIRWAYQLGIWAGKLRRMWEDVVDVVQSEVDASGVDVKIPKELPTRQNMDKWARDVVKPYAEQMQGVSNEIANPLEDLMGEARTSLKEVDEAVQDAGKAAVSATAVTTAADNTPAPKKQTDQKNKKALPVRKPPQGAVVQGSSGLGAWGKPGDKKNSESAQTDAGGSMEFGAWSHPQSPSERTGGSERP